jgi:beta-xylosidase
MRLSSGLTLAALAGPAAAANSTYYNPILPGWHSDPSCTQVDGTFYCVTSTFISFPGLPIYASKDLINWKHVSHVWNRESQLPGYSWATPEQQNGMFAATIRHRDGVFYVICEYLNVENKDSGVLFKSTNPYDDASWSDPVTFPAPKIDPDLFWDDDGKVYVATQGIILQEMNIDTGEMGPAVPLWNGTGGVWPEGPHIYKRGGYYYLMIAEGGTAEDHAITIARAKSITGPYTPSPNNPILTNRGSDEYFQTVGHGDLFQDAAGNWWGTALATRSGPEYKSYPMGRETVLFPVTWPEPGSDWPILQPVRGKMSGWPLPAPTRDVPGDGPFNSDPDVYDFKGKGPGGGAIPRNLVYWRVPREGAFTATEKKGLQVVLGRNRLDGLPGGPEPAAKAISFIGRRQTDSLFTFSVDLDFEPKADGQEAGVTAFLTQHANIQLGVVLVEEKLNFRFNVSGQVETSAVPEGWKAGKTVRLEIKMTKPTEYAFSAMLAGEEKTRVALGTASAELLSGGSGSFVGTLIGVYATCNGAGEGIDCPAGTPNAYFTRWRYTGDGQYFSETETVPREGKGKGKCRKRSVLTSGL